MHVTTRSKRMGESEPEQQPVDPHTALYRHMHEGMSRSTMLYEYLMDNVVKFLSQPQAVEDALNMMCVSLSKTPLESLLLIHEFLQNYHSIVQREQPKPQPQESPFFGRGQ